MENFSKIAIKSKLFTGLPENEIRRLLAGLVKSVREYPKGTIISLKRGIDKEFIFLLKGQIRGELVSTKGKAIQLQEIKAPQFLAPAFLLGGNAMFPITLTAIHDVKALYIPKESFMTLLQKERRVLSNYMEIISNRFSFLTRRIEFLQFNTISKKLAYYLLSLPISPEGRVFLTMAVKDMAGLFGVERPSLSKVIGDFVSRGVIRQISRKEVEILNRDLLFEMMDL